MQRGQPPRELAWSARVRTPFAVLGIRTEGGAVTEVHYLAADEPLRASAPAEISRLEVIASERERAALLAVDARLEPA